MRTILLINPNTTLAMTEQMAAVAARCLPEGVTIATMTATVGMPVIASREAYASAASETARMYERYDGEARGRHRRLLWRPRARSVARRRPSARAWACRILHSRSGRFGGALRDSDDGQSVGGHPERAGGSGQTQSAFRRRVRGRGHGSRRRSPGSVGRGRAGSARTGKPSPPAPAPSSSAAPLSRVCPAALEGTLMPSIVSRRRSGPR